MVPYSHTNRKFVLSIELVDADGNQLGLGEALQLGLDSGRPPGLTPGTPQNMPVAIAMNPSFPAPARYSIAVRIDGAIKKSVSFAVMPIQTPFVPPRTALS